MCALGWVRLFAYCSSEEVTPVHNRNLNNVGRLESQQGKPSFSIFTHAVCLQGKASAAVAGVSSGSGSFEMGAGDDTEEGTKEEEEEEEEEEGGESSDSSLEGMHVMSHVHAHGDAHGRGSIQAHATKIMHMSTHKCTHDFPPLHNSSHIHMHVHVRACACTYATTHTYTHMQIHTGCRRSTRRREGRSLGRVPAAAATAMPIGRGAGRGVERHAVLLDGAVVKAGGQRARPPGEFGGGAGKGAAAVHMRYGVGGRVCCKTLGGYV